MRHEPDIRPARVCADLDARLCADLAAFYRTRRAEYVTRYRAAELVVSRAYARRRALHMGRLARQMETTR
jgi:hypothetical protein